MNTINSERSPTLGRGSPVLVTPPCSVLAGSPGEHGLAMNTRVDPKGNAAGGGELMAQLIACSLLCGSCIYLPPAASIRATVFRNPGQHLRALTLFLKVVDKKRNHIFFFSCEFS